MVRVWGHYVCRVVVCEALVPHHASTAMHGPTFPVGGSCTIHATKAATRAVVMHWTGHTDTQHSATSVRFETVINLQCSTCGMKQRASAVHYGAK